MKRKDYEKPATRVVELQQRCQILTVSDSSSATISITYEEENWIEELDN